MRGMRNDVLTTLAASQRGYTESGLIKAMQDDEAAFGRYGFFNQVRHILYGTTYADLPEYPPAWRIRLSLWLLVWAGQAYKYRFMTPSGSINEHRYRAGKVRRAHLCKKPPHPKPA